MDAPRAHHDKQYLGDEHEELDHLRLRDVVLDGVDPNAQPGKEVVPIPVHHHEESSNRMSPHDAINRV